MTERLRVLHLEDSPRDAELIHHKLGAAGIDCDFVLAGDCESFEAALERESFDLIITDHNIPNYGGIAAIRQARQRQPDTPVIIVSGSIGDEEAVNCLHTGATDYLLKGRLERLGPAVRRAIREVEVQRRRKRAEQELTQRERALSENRERTSFAMAAAGMGVWEIEFATERLAFSDTLAPVFGLSPHEAPQTVDEVFQLIHADDRDAVRAAIGRARSGEGDFEIQYRVIWPDGSTHWVEGHGRSLHGPDGAPVGLLGIGIDITPRKNLEEQLRQAQKLEAVGHLASGVAHDFNNLLTAILGYASFVVDTFDAGDARRSDMQEIIRAGQRASALTSQLLAFSRKQVLRPVAVDINELVTGIRQMLGRLIGEHIDVVTVLAANLQPVRADPGQIEQIVMNLVVNARDAMPAGGRVVIETANVEPDESSATRHRLVHPCSYVMLAVSDTGIGMNEETRRRLFEPFFTTKQPGKGTGLGLATVHGIVEQSGGYIDVYSEPGAGTSFRIYLPVADGVHLAAPAASSAVAPGGTETLLVVEDDEAVRRLIRTYLEKAGYRVVAAPNPLDAETLLEADPTRVALLVTDVIMPGSSGPELFERLSRRRPGLKVLYVSGYASDAIVDHGQLAPGVEFLQKPFTADALTRKVRDVLDRR